MDLGALLLLVAVRHRITGHAHDPNAFRTVLAEALADHLIHDPVQLLPGALQCHWHLELTPAGVEKAVKLLRESGKTVDEMLAGLGKFNR